MFRICVTRQFFIIAFLIWLQGSSTILNNAVHCVPFIVTGKHVAVSPYAGVWNGDYF